MSGIAYQYKKEDCNCRYPDVPGLYYLVWQDESYQYSLYGSFESKEELIRIAEGVKVK